MAVFVYRGITTAGKEVKGTKDAESARALTWALSGGDDYQLAFTGPAGLAADGERPG